MAEVKDYAKQITKGYTSAIARLQKKYEALSSALDDEYAARDREIKRENIASKNAASANYKIGLANAQKNLLDRGLAVSGESVNSEIRSNLSRNSAFASLDNQAEKARQDNAISRSREKSKLISAQLDEEAELEDSMNKALREQYNTDREYEADRADAAEDKRRWETETAEDKRRWNYETAEDKHRWETETAEDKRRWNYETAEDKYRWESETAEDKRRWESETAEDTRRWDYETAEDKRRWESETAEDTRRWDYESAEDKRRWESETAEDTRRWDYETAEDKRRWESETAEDTRRWDYETAEDKRRWESETAEDTRRWESETAEDTRRWESETAEDKRRWESETAEDKRRWETENERAETESQHKISLDNRKFAADEAQRSFENWFSQTKLNAESTDKSEKDDDTEEVDENGNPVEKDEKKDTKKTTQREKVVPEYDAHTFVNKIFDIYDEKIYDYKERNSLVKQAIYEVLNDTTLDPGYKTQVRVYASALGYI